MNRRRLVLFLAGLGVSTAAAVLLFSGTADAEVKPITVALPAPAAPTPIAVSPVTVVVSPHAPVRVALPSVSEAIGRVEAHAHPLTATAATAPASTTIVVRVREPRMRPPCVVADRAHDVARLNSFGTLADAFPPLTPAGAPSAGADRQPNAPAAAPVAVIAAAFAIAEGASTRVRSDSRPAPRPGRTSTLARPG